MGAVRPDEVSEARAILFVNRLQERIVEQCEDTHAPYFELAASLNAPNADPLAQLFARLTQNEVELASDYLRQDAWIVAVELEADLGDGFARPVRAIVVQSKEAPFARARPPTPVSNYNIAIGDRGPRVAEAQALLNGFVPDLPGARGPVDGVFGAHTQALVARFQQANGIIASGQINHDTTLALQNRTAQPLTRQMALDVADATWRWRR